jgi:hypothetical protein
MWSTLLFGYERQSLAEVMTERLFLLAVVLPWLILLERSSKERARGRSLLRWVLFIILMDRVAADHVFWLPVTTMIGALWAAASTRMDAGPTTAASASVRLPLTWLVLGATVASLTAYKRFSGPAAGLVLLFILVAFYGAPRIARRSAAKGNDRPESLPRYLLAVVYAGTAYVLLMGTVQCLSRQNFLQLLLAGVLGWTGLEFARWRRHRASGQPASRTGQTGSFVSAVLCGILGAILLGELYFRLVYDASDANVELRTARRWRDRHVVLNSSGYRDREFPAPDQLGDGPRVLLLGDSFAFGWGIDEDADRLGPALERELVPRLPSGARVFTAAVRGINTPQEAAVFEKGGRRLKPQAVVLAYHLNDIDNSKPRVPRPGPVFTMWHPLTGSSDFLEFLAWRVFERTGISAAPEGNPSVMDYQKDAVFRDQAGAVRHLIRLIREAGAEPVAVLYPFLNLPTETGPQRFALDRIAEVFTSEQVPWLDVSRLVNVNDSRFQANWFDPHPSPALNRVVAAPLADMVAAALKASASRPSPASGPAAMLPLACNRDLGQSASHGQVWPCCAW